MKNQGTENKQKSCPGCGKPAQADHLPFCSKRCQQADLGRWFAGTYAVPAVENEAPEDEEE